MKNNYSTFERFGNMESNFPAPQIVAKILFAALDLTEGQKDCSTNKHASVKFANEVLLEMAPKF
jgi:hypothetical protein